MVQQDLRLFQGYTIDVLEEMRKQGYVPVSIAGLMHLKSGEGRDIDFRRAFIEANLRGKKDWDRFIDKTGANIRPSLIHKGSKEFMPTLLYTGDSYYLHPDGRVKFVRNDAKLRALREKDVLEGKILLGELFGTNLGLLIPAETWDKLTGEDILELNKKRIEEISWKGYSSEEAKKSPEWRFLARDTKLLSRFVDFSYPIRWVPSIPEMKHTDRFMNLEIDSTSGYSGMYNLLHMKPLVEKQEYLLMYNLALRSYSSDNTGLSAAGCMLSRKLAKKIGEKDLDLCSMIGVKEIAREKYFS